MTTTVNADVRATIDIVCALCGADELPCRILLDWNRRFTARMGAARWDPRQYTGFICLSSALWPMASPDERIETIAHETCHIIADYRFGGRQKHGPRWRQMMRLCGYEHPRRCHCVNVDAIHARRLARRLSAACGCPSGIQITPIVARRVRAGAVYSCRRCGQHLTIPQVMPM